MKLKETFKNVKEIADALHNDIFILNTTFKILKEFIEQKVKTKE